MNERALHVALLAASSLACNPPACRCPAPVSGQPVAVSSSVPAMPAHSSPTPEIAEVIYDGCLKNSWQDWGWAPHELTKEGPAKIRFDNWGGWILAKPGNTGDFGGLTFRVKADARAGRFSSNRSLVRRRKDDSCQRNLAGPSRRGRRLGGDFHAP